MEGLFMSITTELMQLDPTLERHNEGHWNEPYIPGGDFSSFNDAGIECETGEFLYALVRLLKPGRVLETGTHWGIGASYIGMGLKENDNKGTLDTIEFLPEIFDRAQQRILKLGLQNVVMQYLMDVKDFKPVDFNLGQDVYDLILLDTEPQTRFSELIKFFPNLREGGYVFIHDLHRHMHQIENEEHGFAWPFGVIPRPILDMVKGGQLRPIHFPTPRGLTGFYKPSSEDFVWES